MKKRKGTISEIRRGKNKEKLLLDFGIELAKLYEKIGILNLSMQYTTYFEKSRGIETDRNFIKIRNRINEIIRDVIINKKFSEDRITEIEKIRKEVKDRVDTITAYLSAFENFNYVLTRKLPNHSYDGIDIDVDDETRNILSFIFRTDDNLHINSNVQRVISELPVRYTRGKFEEIIENSCNKYIGTEKKSFKAFSYMVRQAGMIYYIDELENLYPDLADELEYFKSFEFEKAEKKLLIDESIKINQILTRCSDLLDEGIGLMEIVNEVYLLLLNFTYIEECEELEIIKQVNEAFFDEVELDILIARINPLLEGIVGKPEKLTEDVMEYELALFEIENMYLPLIKDFGYEKLYDSLFKCRILKQGSLFADIEELSDIGTLTESDIDRAKKELKEEFSTIFNEVDRSVRKAIMAQVIGTLPVYFENRTEIMEYVLTSLNSCATREELIGTVNAIREIMQE